MRVPTFGLIRRFSPLGRLSVLLLLSTLAPTVARADEPELRTWKDLSDRFELEARYLGVEGENVLLKKADGGEIQVALEKLSVADREYVAEIQKRLEGKRSPRLLENENPFQPTPAGPTQNQGRFQFRRPNGEVIVQSRSSTNAPLAALPESGEWKVEVPASPVSTDPPARTQPIQVPGMRDFFEQSKGLVVNKAGTHALIGWSMNRPGTDQPTSRISLFDLKMGKSKGETQADGALTPMAFSNSGDRVLMRIEKDGLSDRLELWELTPQRFLKIWSLIPYSDLEGGDRDIIWADFVDANQFTTISRRGALIVWNLDSLQASASLTIQDECRPALTVNGRLLAFISESRVGLLDVEAGKIVAIQPMPVQQDRSPGLAFSPSGKRFAATAGDRLYVWNTEDGSLYRDILLPHVRRAAEVPPLWATNDQILTAHRVLIDVESHLKLWEYEGSDLVVAGADGLCWFLLAPSHNRPGTLVPARIPQARALAALQKSVNDPNFAILRPGVSVTLDTSGIADSLQRAKATNVLTGKLRQNQVKTTTESPLVLQAGVEPGDVQSPPRSNTSELESQKDRFTIRPHISRLRLLDQGRLVWESAVTSLPLIGIDFRNLDAEEFQSDRLKMFEQPNYGFFEQVELPGLYTRAIPGGTTSLGQSQVSTTGLQ